MKRVLPFLITLMLLSSCSKAPEGAAFSYPAQKMWAHKVNTLEEANTKGKVFEGIEIDVVYSQEKGLVVSHEDEFSPESPSLERLLEDVPRLELKRLWIDAKNLSEENAPIIAHLINEISRRHSLKDRLIVEGYFEKALQIIKDSGICTSLWVEDLSWGTMDTLTWKNHTQEQIDICHPNALSAHATMMEPLIEYFPTANIHLWDTPRDYTPQNVEHTLTLCAHPQVRVVLVDYPLPQEQGDE